MLMRSRRFDGLAIVAMALMTLALAARSLPAPPRTLPADLAGLALEDTLPAAPPLHRMRLHQALKG